MQPRNIDVKLKVAHVGAYVPDDARGDNKARALLLHWLPKYGIDVQVWHLSESIPGVNYRQQNGIDILELPRYSRPWAYARRLPTETKQALLDAARKVDLVHFHSGFIPENPLIAGLLESPYVVSPHGSYSPNVLIGTNRSLKRAWFTLRERRYVNSAAFMHAVSEGEGAELTDLGIRSRIVFIPNGIGPELIEPEQDRLAGLQKPHFLFLGRLAIRQKGLDRLLEAFELFVREGGEAWKLVLVGPDWRNNLAVLEEQARAAGIEDRVVFLDPIFGDEKKAMLQECYAFVHTSRWEGLPISVLEALSVGSPVLITKETNLGDLVQRYRAGYVVGVSREEIAAAMRRLSSLPRDEYGEMRKQAVRLVQDNLAIDKVSEAMAHSYRAAIASLPTR